MAQVDKTLSLIDLARRYKWAINNVGLDKTNKLGINSIQKYWRCIRQFKIQLDCLYN